MKALVLLLLLTTAVSSQCIQEGDLLVCPFNAGSFNSLSEPIELNLQSIISEYSPGITVPAALQSAYLYNTINLDETCFDVSKHGSSLKITYKASCQACHSQQQIDVWHPLWGNRRVRIGFEIECSDVDTLFLGDSVDNAVISAINAYAVNARERNEKVKLIDYASGNALVDLASTYNPTSQMCLFPRSIMGFPRRLDPNLIRTQCVDYLKEHIIHEDGALVLLGDESHGGVLLYEATENEDVLNRILTERYENSEVRLPSNQILSDQFYDSYFRAHYAQSDYDPEKALIISRLPGNSELIIELLERGPVNVIADVMVIGVQPDFDFTGGLAEEEYEMLMVDHANVRLLRAPPFCFTGNNCKFDLLQDELARITFAYFSTHGTGYEFNAVNYTQNEYGGISVTSYTILNTESDFIAPPIVLTSACYGNNLQNKYGVQKILARVMLEKGAVNTLGFNQANVGNGGIGVIYRMTIENGYSLGKAVKYTPLIYNPAQYLHEDGAPRNLELVYKLQHLTLLGLPNSKIRLDNSIEYERVCTENQLNNLIRHQSLSRIHLLELNELLPSCLASAQTGIISRAINWPMRDSFEFVNELIIELINAGASVNELNPLTGESPLHASVRFTTGVYGARTGPNTNQRIEFITTLFNSGADAYARIEPEGKTPCELAEEDYPELVPAFNGQGCSN